MYCTNCGSKLEDNYNYCINCGTKMDKSDVDLKNREFMEKLEAKRELKRVIGTILFNKTFYNKLLENGLDVVPTGEAIRKQVKNEIESGRIKSEEVEFRVNQLIDEYKIKNEEEKKKLKMIDSIFESEEIKSEIRKSGIDQKYIISIKNSLKKKLIDKEENMSEEEALHYIKKQLNRTIRGMKKPRVSGKKELGSQEIEGNEIQGGYCGLSCKHFYEEFFDSGGYLIGDYADGGIIEYYCNLGQSPVYGKFCRHYE